MIDADTRSVYDGWMLSMSFNASGPSGSDPHPSYAWGPDLPGGYGGLGGRGGAGGGRVSVSVGFSVS